MIKPAACWAVGQCGAGAERTALLIRQGPRGATSRVLKGRVQKTLCLLGNQALNLGFVQQLALAEFLGRLSVADSAKVENLRIALAIGSSLPFLLRLTST